MPPLPQTPWICNFCLQELTSSALSTRTWSLFYVGDQSHPNYSPHGVLGCRALWTSREVLKPATNCSCNRVLTKTPGDKLTRASQRTASPMLCLVVRLSTAEGRERLCVGEEGQRTKPHSSVDCRTAFSTRSGATSLATVNLRSLQEEDCP